VRVDAKPDFHMNDVGLPRDSAGFMVHLPGETETGRFVRSSASRRPCTDGGGSV